MPLASWLLGRAHQIGGLLAPPRCIACDAWLDRDVAFCDACAPGSDLVRDRLPNCLDVIASARYEAGIADAIRRLKYGGRPDIARALGRRMARAVQQANVGGPLVLVPVPLHPKRLAERSYDQAALLAVCAAKCLRWPVEVRALRRIRETREQASLSRGERVENASGAFATNGDRPRHVLLVDDVVTTGETARACASALEAEGSSVVAVLAVAHTP